MTFDKSSIKNILYSWVSSIITTKQFIWLDQNSPRPSLPYLGGRIGSYSFIHDDYVGSPDSSGYSEITGNREFVLYLEAYGNTSFESLEQLVMSLNKIDVISLLISNNIVFVNEMNDIVDLSELLDSRYEERASLDLLFRIASSDTDENRGIIETVKIELMCKNEIDVIKTDLITITST